MSAIARDGQAETLTEIVDRLRADPERLARLKGILDDEQMGAMVSVLAAVEGQRELKLALGIIKSRMTPEQGVELQKLLDPKELAALSQVLDTIEEAPAPAQGAK
jgi:hypothetical protein